ncbi:hypothetical protein Salat_2884900 [Sesamum alatum]|uniref:Uncharacterized protein n=1 Tax=Sesamum alatum TaxID=300844 RepID=A0AAE1XI42_9LAMI|nr:hypothetical protein Salat_2884900 [Sesamum alatum]
MERRWWCVGLRRRLRGSAGAVVLSTVAGGCISVGGRDEGVVARENIPTSFPATVRVGGIEGTWVREKGSSGVSTLEGGVGKSSFRNKVGLCYQAEFQNLDVEPNQPNQPNQSNLPSQPVQSNMHESVMTEPNMSNLNRLTNIKNGPISTGLVLQEPVVINSGFVRPVVNLSAVNEGNRVTGDSISEVSAWGNPHLNLGIPSASLVEGVNAGGPDVQCSTKEGAPIGGFFYSVF